MYGHVFHLQDVNECHLISSLRPSQEVATPLSAVPVLSQPLSEGQFSSLLHTTVDGFQFIFAGTVNGKLYWVSHKQSLTVLGRDIRRETMPES